MESVDNKEEKKDYQESYRQEIHSKVIRAGKRTYFFDVKSTRNNEYYLTITESKKKFTDKGKFHYEKHKIFLYQEDFEKFQDSLDEVVQFIAENQPEMEPREERVFENKSEVPVEPAPTDGFSNVEFEDI